jgi:hypothetical protein
LTLRELFWMVEGRQRDHWNHTAQLLALFYNAFRGRGQRALEPADFHPLVKKPVATVTLKQLSELGVLALRKEQTRG